MILKLSDTYKVLLFMARNGIHSQEKNNLKYEKLICFVETLRIFAMYIVHIGVCTFTCYIYIFFNVYLSYRQLLICDAY